MKTKAIVATLLVAAAANVEAYFASPYPRRAVSPDESGHWIVINGNSWPYRAESELTTASPSGSLTISADLAALVQLREYEKILVGNLRNGERFETYVIYGSPRKGSIQLNGATAHLGTIGDRITIMNFAQYSPEEAVLHQPQIIVLDEKNRVVR